MDTDRPALSIATRGSRLSFDGYVLDLDRGVLSCGDREIDLRPKAFSVLRFLAENDRRLISKEELFGAVWPDVIVTDDALVQVVGELRRALGEDGQRLVKTIPRRGYRFESSVTRTTEAEPGTAIPGPPEPTPPVDLPDDGGVAAPPDTRSRAAEPAAERPADQGTPRQLEARWHSAVSYWRQNARRLALRLAFAGALAVLILAALISRALEPSRTGAPGSSAPALQSIGGKPAIAILPFAFLGDANASAHLADGVTQDLIAALGKFSGLTVMSWNAVAAFKTKHADPGEIARTLHVRYQVEGSVRRTADRIRIASQLVGPNGQVLWSGQLDGQSADFFAIQDELTSRIVNALAVRVTQAELRRAMATPPEALETYDLVLRARPALLRPTRAGMVEARALLRRAIEREPGYAPAHSALAEAYHIDLSWGWAESPALTTKRAQEHAETALQLNDSDLGARIVLARGHLLFERHDQALAELDRAIGINPSDGVTLAARGNILTWLGHADAAIEALEHGQRVDPHLNAMDRFSLGLAYYLARRFEDAAAQAALSLRQNPDSHFSLVILAAANAQLGRTDEAASAVAAIRQKYPTFDAREFGTKLRKAADLEHLRIGLRKAGLYSD